LIDAIATRAILDGHQVIQLIGMPRTGVARLDTNSGLTLLCRMVEHVLSRTELTADELEAILTRLDDLRDRGFPAALARPLAIRSHYEAIHHNALFHRRIAGIIDRIHNRPHYRSEDEEESLALTPELRWQGATTLPLDEDTAARIPLGTLQEHVRRRLVDHLHRPGGWKSGFAEQLRLDLDRYEAVHQQPLHRAFGVEDVDSVIRLTAAYRATVRVTRITLAAEQHRLAHNAWPESLDDLEIEAQRDPFTGGDLRMARRPDGLVIYALGPNQQDDGGVPEAGADDGRREDVDDIAMRLFDPAVRNQRRPADAQMR